MLQPQHQQVSQEEIDRVLARLAQKGVGTSTKPVLQVNIERQMQARNNGYPKHMYHTVLDSRIALNEEQESVLVTQGYGPAYTHKAYPRYLFRLNLSPVFDPEQREDLLPEQRSQMNRFVEERLVLTEAAEAVLARQKVPRECGPWVESPTKIMFPDEVDEAAKDERIAKLQGQLEEARRSKSDEDKRQAPKAGGKQPTQAELQEQKA